MQTGMTIIFVSASMRDIPAKPVQGQPLRTAGPGPAFILAGGLDDGHAGTPTGRLTGWPTGSAPAPFRSVFSCRVMPAPP